LFVWEFEYLLIESLALHECDFDGVGFGSDGFGLIFEDDLNFIDLIGFTWVGSE
jgi:hypothetical protein